MVKVMVITSGRADYGYLYPVIKELQTRTEHFDVKILAPENHPSLCDEFKDCVVYISDIWGMDEYGRVYDETRRALEANETQLVILLGDRFEIHACATAAKLLNIPIAHLHGGEHTYGAFDEELRNSITMMSTYHFASTDIYARNIMNMVYYNFLENMCIADCNIYNVGSPTVDMLLNTIIHPKDVLQGKFNKIDFSKNYIIASFHPVTKELEYTRQYITNLLNALYRWGEQVIFIMPNIDPKNEIIREQIITASQKSLAKWQVCENVERDLFISLIAHAHMMVGNSSAGIIEAGYFNLPVVNIGDRQDGRIKPDNVYDCEPDEESIFLSIAKLDNMKQLYSKKLIKMLYGDGHAAVKIVDILCSKYQQIKNRYW
jgi:UDP-hydrolysing UDP-N-acetyl-D-glucosamine 2-epimerase